MPWSLLFRFGQRYFHQVLTKKPCLELVSSQHLTLLSGLYLLQPGLVDSNATVIIPSDDCVIFVRLLNGAEFSGRLAEVA